MTQETDHQAESSDQQAQTSDPQPAHVEAAQATVSPEAPTIEADELAALRREVDELRDRNLRLMAELQNLHKRAQREKHEALRFAEAELARELLVVVDDLERTMESARTATDAATVAEGVRIIYEHFLKVLKSCNIEPIQAVGRPFDPTFHEALLQQPSDEHPAGTVIQELARGYRMHERVLRPSRVVVSSGPPTSAQASQSESEE